jgi:transcriptional regulator with XRE-family HTH domain
MTKRNSFATLIQSRREELQLSIRELARRSNLDAGTLSKLESAQTRPSADSIRALADVLKMPATELFTAAGYMTSGDLPSLRPYMRAKYQGLPDDAVAEVERFVQDLAERHGISEPVDGEDEAE